VKLTCMLPGVIDRARFGAVAGWSAGAAAWTSLAALARLVCAVFESGHIKHQGRTKLRTARRFAAALAGQSIVLIRFPSHWKLGGISARIPRRTPEWPL